MMTKANTGGIRRASIFTAGAIAIAATALIGAASPSQAELKDPDDKAEVAFAMAELLRAGRSVISKNQDLINDPEIGAKNLSGDAVLEEALAIFKERTGIDYALLDKETLAGQMLSTQAQSIVAVMEANQDEIDAKGVGFKGFIPAVFARLVGEEFGDKMDGAAAIKVTAPINLVRNRKARPDAWERGIIEEDFLSADWVRGETFHDTVDVSGSQAFRMLIPEYYSASCLACHGEPAGEVDPTGYPKEGGKEGDLGGVISVMIAE